MTELCCGSTRKNKSQSLQHCKKDSKSPDVADSQSNSLNSKVKYTPLEQQFLEIKSDHPNTILFVECGYKYRLFGEDAKIASQELNIGCFPYHSFLSASIPTQRLFVHVRRLVSKGYKVGVVEQTETAAIKAVGNNKSSLFSRKLKALYTKATLIAEDSLFKATGEEDNLSISCPVPGHLMCILENPSNQKGTVNIGVVAAQPSTGSVLYSSFDDGPTRCELESCLIHVQPVEVLIPLSLSSESENLIKNIAILSPTTDDRMRIEQITDETGFSSALIMLSEFYKASTDEEVTGGFHSNDGMKKILELPPLVICCFATVLKYLRDFNLQSVLSHTSTFTPMTCSSKFMQLNATTLHNLELFRNITDNLEHGSLFWAINYTSTKFGTRLLKSWLSRPLTDAMAIKKRQDITSEIIKSTSSIFGLLKTILYKLPDLETGLCVALHLKCTCFDFVLLLKALVGVKENIEILQQRIQEEINTPALKNLLLEIPSFLNGIESFLSSLDENAARKGDKNNIFVDLCHFPAVSDTKKKIASVMQKLNDLCPIIAKQLSLPKFSYSSVSGQEYLIEVCNKQLHSVPHNWIKINATKQVSRFRSSDVQELFNELRQLREQLDYNCKEAWLQFLSNFNKNYHIYKKAVMNLSQLDCYFSFTQVAKQAHYCKPTIAEDNHKKIYIIGGRHPVVEKLIANDEQYVANNTALDSSRHCLILTGPNMGGKSSYIRQVALIIILAQIGSYVPAETAEVSVFDGIYTRMGASDNIHHRKSTFMMEMQETAVILKQATPNSLVMLDELGRGTSTHDGMAIAYATLFHLMNEVKCLVLFVTHYPPVAELQMLYPNNIFNYHMTYIIDNSDVSCESEENLSSSLVFLHQLGEGISEKSYGINVAQLAGISATLLKKAELKSCELENFIKENRTQNIMFLQLMKSDLSNIKSNLLNVKDTS